MKNKQTNKQKENNMISIRLGQTKVKKKKMGIDQTLKQCMSSLMDTVGE